MRGRASTSSSFSYQWTYDVFINFRGEDTRYGFTGNLYKALCQKGIRPFMDDEELRKGDDITPTLLKAIEQSRMAFTVFSQNYASSTFCLDELVKIIQCIKGNNRLVWPIFYDVDPSDVRHQKGNYEKALAMHLKTFKADEKKVKSWKWALNNAANTSGLHFRHDQYEHQFIEKIVQEISSKINRVPLHIAEYPVGWSSRVLKINSLLRLGSNDEVNMVGICGIGGMGKTTIARAVYNSIADHFEGLCFLHDIKEESTKQGLAQMQERMLSKILGVDIKVEDVNEGIPIIKRRLNQKKILLILDNVDKREQLEKLAGECCWFGLGSRIIITTRDKHLLKRHGVLVNQIYEMEGFDDEESHQLLSWHAFKDNQFDPSYKEVLNCVVHYAQGLPLALEVIGSHLFRKSVNEWKAAIDIYQRIPDKGIQQILKVSYNNLTEVEQEIFLDIACFFNRADLEYVKNMVEHAHDFDPSYGIGVLIDKCLIKIEDNCIRMHDLIRDMGREIVRKESPREPGKRSRLWFHMDIVHVLENNTGTDKINAIILKYHSKDIINLNEKAFQRMKNLKILILRDTRFSKCPKYLPKSLRVLDWWGYPASSLQLLGQVKRMENLSVLDLCFCPFITQITDMSSVPNLTELSIMCCQNLIEIHDSVGYLRKLRVLNAWCCENLRHFPRRMKLPALEKLVLSGCLSLEKFPEIAEKMEYITVLDLKDTNLELPFSICNLTMLQGLRVSNNHAGLQLSSNIAVLQELKDTSIEGCEELQSSILHECQEARPMHFSNMKIISLTHCNISDGFLPICLPWFVNVMDLNLSGSNFTILPACIKECHCLTQLDLCDCKHLREIKGIPPNIENLYAINCILLNSESRSILMSHSQEILETGNKQFLVPGSMMPESFSYRSKGPSLSFWFHDKCPNISFCCVLHKGHPSVHGLSIKVIINGEKIILNEIFKWVDTVFLLEDLVVFIHVPSKIIFKGNGIDIVSLASEWNHVEFCIIARRDDGGCYAEYFYSEDECNYVKEVGMHVKEEEIRREDFQSINPHKRKKLFHDFSLNLSFKASNRTCGIMNDKGTQTHAKSQGNQSLKFTCKRDGYFTPISKLKFEIAKVTYEGRLVDSEGAERFVQLMQRHSQNTESDWGGRILLLQIIENSYCHWISEADYSRYCKLHTLGIKALPLVNKWLQDVQKGKFDDTENDEFVEQFLLASFRALKKLPPESVYELQSCKIPESLRLLFKHKSSKIQREAQSVLDLWRRIMPGGMP